MEILKFWRVTGWRSRIGLSLAFLSILMNAATYLRLFREHSLIMYAPHVAIMALFLVVFFRIGYHHYLTFKRPTASVHGSSPRWLWIACVLALVYVLVMMTTLPNTPDDPNVMVRGFSAFWAFFGVLLAGVSHVVDQRIDALRRWST